MADRTRPRAQATVIGFVLVFGIVLTMVGLVSVIGLNELQGARDAEQLENAERAFDVLADNIEDTYRGGAPARATEIRLSEATLGFGDPTEVTVTVDGTAHTRTIRPIVYDSEGQDTQIVYESGAVIRVERDGARLARPPALLITSEATALQFIQTKAETDRQLGGTTTVLVRTTRTKSNVVAVTSNADVSIEIDTTTDRAPAWARYFESTGPISNCAVSGGTVTCPASGTFSTDELRLVRSRIGVDLRP